MTGNGQVMLWTKPVLLALVATIVVIYVVIVVSYNLSNYNYVKRLEAGSEVIETAKGPIEVAQVGEGPAVLLLHGTPGGYDQAIMIADSLVPAGFSVLTVSRPGYLRTPADAGKTLAGEADLYAALLDALAIDRVAIMGGSGGAPAAIAFAEGHPDRVWAVVQMFGLSGGIPPEDAVLVPPSFSERLIDIFLGETFELWVMLQLGERFPNDTLLSEGFGMLNEDSRQRISSDPAKVDALMEMMWTGYPYRRELGRQTDVAKFIKLDQSGAASIQSPIFVVHGTDDNNASYENVEALVATMENPEFLTIEGADHWIFISRPEDWVPQTTDFLSRHAPRTN